MLLIKTFAGLFTENKISQASAALAYYLTMTAFPLMIVVYSLLERSYDSLSAVLSYAETLLSAELIEFVMEFADYVSNSQNAAMLPLGFALLLSYASAAIRSLQNNISCMQGGAEYRGLRSYLISFVYSLMLLSLIYFALVIMLMGRELTQRLSNAFGAAPILSQLRFFILAPVSFLLLMGVFHLPKRPDDSYSVVPGAMLSSLALVIISPVFSAVMGRSMKYSLVYGSLASLILLMLWLYMCCIVIYSGAVLNLSLCRIKAQDH